MIIDNKFVCIVHCILIYYYPEVCSDFLFFPTESLITTIILIVLSLNKFIFLNLTSLLINDVILNFIVKSYTLFNIT